MPPTIPLAGLLTTAVIITSLARLYLNKRKSSIRLRSDLCDTRQKLRLMVILFEETLGRYPGGTGAPPLDERISVIFDHLSENAPGVPIEWYQLRPLTRLIFKRHIAGQTQAQLARQFKLTRNQVRAHLNRACQALGAADIRQAAARAGKYGLLDDVL